MFFRPRAWPGRTYVGRVYTLDLLYILTAKCLCNVDIYLYDLFNWAIVDLYLHDCASISAGHALHPLSTHTRAGRSIKTLELL